LTTPITSARSSTSAWCPQCKTRDIERLSE
jgi:hypothetical protein